MILNQQIIKLRKQHGDTQEALAAKLYVSRQTVSNWETGKSYPDLENLLLLSAIFDVSLDELVKGDVSTMKQAVSRAHLQGYYTTEASVMLLWPFVLGAVPHFIDTVWIYLVYAGLMVTGVFAMWRLKRLERTLHIETYAQVLAFLQDKAEGSPSIQRQLQRWWNRQSPGSRWLVLSLYGGYVGLAFYISVALFRLL
ncbi:helix-turn-helix transcriptional regulator [Lacticaseibacillus daqingensis]|uniref:helix-turn-helix transcriptional regulator n=1 Tax=Lacticaseibacillus daqingensis TaxID=2486014 RepID=UPI000F79AF70|nr:helix-turn-helix transcriptional regulator [Lacticaseibacillus daqingensis]